MGEEKPFRTLSDLLAALSTAGSHLDQGALDLDGLDTACQDARELYERLVVIRHKAREQRHGGAPPEQATADPIRLDTRPSILPGQTSLIDAIAATEQEEVPAPGAKRKKEPAAKARGQEPGIAVHDLAKAISMNHKFWFTAELFNGDRSAFEKAVDTLNGAGGREQAHAFVQAEVLAKLDKQPDEEALTAFMELLDRRFA